MNFSSTENEASLINAEITTTTKFRKAHSQGGTNMHVISGSYVQSNFKLVLKSKPLTILFCKPNLAVNELKHSIW